jgi:hypothetical protein
MALIKNRRVEGGEEFWNHVEKVAAEQRVGSATEVRMSASKLDKITLENCGPENVEFNREWHLASANRVSVYGKPYARPGEAIITANVGAWYETACYWRDEAEKARKGE